MKTGAQVMKTNNKEYCGNDPDSKIWLFLLPLALVELAGFYTIIWAPLTALGVIGMRGIALELENPFGYDVNDIRLSELTMKIEGNTKGLHHFVDEADDDDGKLHFPNE